MPSAPMTAFTRWLKLSSESGARGTPCTLLSASPGGYKMYEHSALRRREDVMENMVLSRILGNFMTTFGEGRSVLAGGQRTADRLTETTSGHVTRCVLLRVVLGNGPMRPASR